MEPRTSKNSQPLTRPSTSTFGGEVGGGGRKAFDPTSHVEVRCAVFVTRAWVESLERRTRTNRAGEQGRVWSSGGGITTSVNDGSWMKEVRRSDAMM